MTIPCDYPPCPEPAVAKVTLGKSGNEAHLCVAHAAYAAEVKRKISKMSDDQYAAYIRDLIDTAVANEEQRKQLGYLLRANPKGKP